MENIKEITLPDGWVVDKVENGKVILKEDDAKPDIKWNRDKDGVEVIADGYHFVVANMPNMYTSWDKAKILCEKLGGYLPRADELKLMVKYNKEINQCFKDNGSPLCLLGMSGHYWSSSESSCSEACYVNSDDGYVNDANKYYHLYVRAFRCA